jgi:hypothetical protein
MFALARDRAGMAADTRITVEQETESGHRIRPVPWQSDVIGSFSPIGLAHR